MSYVQKPWLKPYIELNEGLRKQAKNDLFKFETTRAPHSTELPQTRPAYAVCLSLRCLRIPAGFFLQDQAESAPRTRRIFPSNFAVEGSAHQRAF